MSSSQVQVSIDAGQSSVRVRIREGLRLREIAAPGVRNDSDAVDQIAMLLAHNDGFDADSLAVGLSGFDCREDAAQRLSAATAGAAVTIAHDSITGYLGANGDAPGVVAAVGTGTVVFGVGASITARVDGWGALLGDAGSAHWIGRAGLEAVLRAADGRGAATVLAADAVAEFGPVEQLYLALQAASDRVQRVAAFAPRVTAAAASDAVAGEILDVAAREIVLSLGAALRRISLAPAEARISVVGQTVTAPALRERVAAGLRMLDPGAALAPRIGDPIDGVEALHALAPTHPLVRELVRA